MPTTCIPCCELLSQYFTSAWSRCLGTHPSNTLQWHVRPVAPCRYTSCLSYNFTILILRKMIRFEDSQATYLAETVQQNRVLPYKYATSTVIVFTCLIQSAAIDLAHHLESTLFYMPTTCIPCCESLSPVWAPHPSNTLQWHVPPATPCRA